MINQRTGHLYTVHEATYSGLGPGSGSAKGTLKQLTYRFIDSKPMSYGAADYIWRDKYTCNCKRTHERYMQISLSI